MMSQVRSLCYNFKNVKLKWDVLRQLTFKGHLYIFLQVSICTQLAHDGFVYGDLSDKLTYVWDIYTWLNRFSTYMTIKDATLCQYRTYIA